MCVRSFEISPKGSEGGIFACARVWMGVFLWGICPYVRDECNEVRYESGEAKESAAHHHQIYETSLFSL